MTCSVTLRCYARRYVTRLALTQHVTLNLFQGLFYKLRFFTSFRMTIFECNSFNALHLLYLLHSPYSLSQCLYHITDFIASIMPVGSAKFFPAISKAVPCPGEVLTTSKPIVILTVFDPATVFIGINP